MLDLIIAAALLQTGDPCQAVPQGSTARSCPEWRSLRRTDRVEYFENAASIVRRGATFEISLRFVYAAASGSGMRSGIVRARYDCGRRTEVTLRRTAYDAAGAVLWDRPVPADVPPAQPPPHTPGEAVLALHCPR